MVAAFSVFLSQGTHGKEEDLVTAESEPSHWAEHGALRLSTYLMAGGVVLGSSLKPKGKRNCSIYLYSK